MDSLVWLLPTLPFVSGLFTYLLAPVMGRSSVRISLLGAVLTLLLAIYLLSLKLGGAAPQQHMLGDAWGILLFDPLSVLMAVVIAAISLLVRLYSVRYIA